MRFSIVLAARKIAELTLKHTNLPESYLREVTETVEYVAPKLRSHRQITLKKYKTYYDMYPPGSQEFETANFTPMKLPKVWVEPVKDWSYFRGDRVEILDGKDKGKQGFISHIVQERNWVLVKGLNLVLPKDSKGSMKLPQEAPLLINRQVALVDPIDLKPTKVDWRYDDDGNRVRVSLRTGAILPISELEDATNDYYSRKAYVEGDKDTVNDVLKEITFVPKLKTFEMDIMDEYGIKEYRMPAKTYWY